MPRSIVTGAAGFIGSHIVDRLLALGHDVIGVDCFTDYYERTLKEANVEEARADGKFQLLEADLLTMDLPELLEGANYVFHQAGQAGVRPSWGAHFAGYIRNNIEATQHLLEAAKHAALTKFVFASSSSIYGDAKDLPVTEETIPQPISPYGVTKLAAEHLCSLYAKVYNLPTVSLRYFTVYGPRQRPEMAIQHFLSACRSGEPVTLFGDGTQTRDFTFVGDIAEANVLAMEASGSAVINVCGGSQISLNALLDLLQETSGRPLRIERKPAAQGDAKHTLGDNSLAQRVLGFKPQTTLAEGVVAQWRWLSQREP
ncbi:MAG: NAD-dependent epimerase/dehydratase family protein [Chloroflexi bacterium]|nr:NAD-dependent epimerase/dehydratase family protein [Chloroflexota bacterium]MCI0889571.1 NAD-dependent epimerase/dehydratase family protein [Chloroflexota bacterium]